jgi:hypothetical protein
MADYLPRVTDFSRFRVCCERKDSITFPVQLNSKMSRPLLKVVIPE